MYQQFRNLGTFHTKTTSHVLGARSHAWKSIESSVQSLFDFSYTCTLVFSVNRPIAFLPVISRCRRRSRCFITTAISSLMFGSMATKTKKPLNLKLPVSLRSRKHFAMKESIMQQLIVQFIGNRKITTRWNATKVSRKCITGTAQVVGHFFGWFNFFFFFYFGYPDLALNTQTRFSNLKILNTHKQNGQTLSCSCCQWVCSS